MKDQILNEIKASIEVKQRLLEDSQILNQINTIASNCLATLRSGGKVIFAGNGGSFADAQHLSAEFISKFMFDRPPLASVALGTNSSAISAIGNDYGFDQVFSRELVAIAEQRDFFIAISTSGNSPNILCALKAAKELKLKSVCLTGENGGKAKELCECICIPSKETARIQESHILIGHIVCSLVESIYFKERI